MLWATLNRRFGWIKAAPRVGTFELARVMGTSLEMIERTYGHLVRGADDASGRDRTCSPQGATRQRSVRGEMPTQSGLRCVRGSAGFWFSQRRNDAALPNEVQLYAGDLVAG